MADILPPAPIDAPFGAYGWVDWYRKVRDVINNSQTVAFTSITGLPTTTAGYGITDALYVTANKIKIPTAVSNGAGAAAGTLLNAPVAGNPTKWIPFDDNGTIRYIPAW